MISIIVTAFNNTEYIKECLDSIVESCENTEFEVLLGVDNCQKTFDYLVSIKDKLNENIKIYFFKKNSGTYIVRNTLSLASKYEKLLFFDSDDVMRKILVSEVIDSLDVYDFVRYGYLAFSNKLQYNTRQVLKLQTYVPHTGSFGIKKSLFLEMNGFEPWVCAADGEFIWRVSANNKKIKDLRIIGLFYRRHSDNLTVNSTTGMNSPIRKKYHNRREEKQKNNESGPLQTLEVSERIEYNNNYDEIKKYFVIGQDSLSDRLKVSKNFDKKEISIIIPTFNNIEFLFECFESIRKSIKDLNCEILVGIDGCERTLEYLKKNYFDDRFRFFNFEENMGPYIIKNSLTKISTSDNLLFFDSDDIMRENMVADTIYTLERFQMYKPMYIDFNNWDKLTEDKIVKTNKFGEGVFGVKKSFFLSLNGFEGWKCAADSDFMARAYNKKVSLRASRDVVFLRRIHPKSLTVHPDTNLSSKLRAQYYGLSKKKRKDDKCEILKISKFSEIKVNHLYNQKKEAYEKQKNEVEELITKTFNSNNQKKEPIDYNKINQITERKGVYNPQTSKKPVRQNIPNKREELIEMRKNSLSKQVRVVSPGKPNRRNGLPNIF